MPELTQEMKDAYWAEWQQTQDHWLAMRAALATLQPVAWMSEFRTSVNSNWSTDFSPAPFEENQYFRNIRPVYDLGVTQPLPKVHDHLIITVEEAIKDIQPVPVMGDEDSIHLTERQEGFKDGLKWTLRFLMDNNYARDNARNGRNSEQGFSDQGRDSQRSDPAHLRAGGEAEGGKEE